MPQYPLTFYSISIFFSLGIITGVFLPFSLPILPAVFLGLLAILLSISAVRLHAVAGWLLVGMGFTLIASSMVTFRWLPVELENKEISISGVVGDFPRKTERGWQFDFYPDNLDGKIRLSFLQETGKSFEPEFGCRYHMLVKLKRPRGLLNFDQFDYQVWLMQAGYVATGYIRTVNRCDPIHPASILSLRAEIANWINTINISDYAKSTLLGLLIGSYADIDVVQWQVLRDSGTIHLLSVSGLHIVLVASLIYFMVKRITSLLVFPLRWLPVEYWAGSASFACAVFYALLAGFSVATQRSLIMVGVAVLQKLLQGKFAFGTVFVVSLLLVLLMNPLSILSAGFWFSFWATAVLMLSSYGYNRSVADSKVRLYTESLRMQWLVFILMAPVLLFVYGRLPLLSFPFNLLAVPWVSFLSLPLGFAALLLLPISQPLAEWLLQAAGWTLDVYWQVMQLGVAFGKNWQFLMGGISKPALLFAVTGLAVLMLLPRGVPLRFCGVFLCLPIFWPGGVGLSRSEAEVTVLDVGQGLAVIVQTARHVLVYDTGDRSSDRFDAGRDIVAPALRNFRKEKIDLLMISHSDSDHAGGRLGLLGEFSATQLWTGDPEELSTGSTRYFYCRAGMHWHWDGVSFKVLHPDAAEKSSDNNRSCVLMVDTGKKRMLLTGDIEKEAERQLSNGGHDIRADVLLAPHHGSKSSSSPTFLDSVNPEMVVVSSGYLNRFRHPAEQVVARYQDRGLAILNTADMGAIRIRFGNSASRIETALCDQRNFWRVARYNALCQLPSL